MSAYHNSWRGMGVRRGPRKRKAALQLVKVGPTNSTTHSCAAASFSSPCHRALAHFDHVSGTNSLDSFLLQQTPTTMLTPKLLEYRPSTKATGFVEL